MAVVGVAELDTQLNAGGILSALGPLGARVTQAFSGMGRSGALAFAAAFAGAVAIKQIADAISSSVQAAIDFESSFTGVRKTVDASEAEFDALAAGFRELAKEIPVNVNELNRLGEVAGQLGVEADNILEFTEVIAKLGVTTDLATEEAAVGLARLANITELPQDKFEDLANVIVELGNNLATNEPRILNFGLRIAAAGKLAGLSQGEILGIAGAASSVTPQIEAAATAIQRVLNAVTTAVATGNEDLQQFADVAGSESAEQFASAWRDNAADTFIQVIEGLGSQSEAAITTLDELDLANERTLTAVLSLAGAGDLLRRSLGLQADALREASALTTEAELRFGTLESQMELLGNQVEDVRIAVGQALLPALRSVTEFMSQVGVPALEAFGEAVIDAAVFLAERFGPVLENVKEIAGDLAPVFGNLASVVGTIFGGAVVGAIVGVSAALEGLTGFLAENEALALALAAALTVALAPAAGRAALAVGNLVRVLTVRGGLALGLGNVTAAFGAAGAAVGRFAAAIGPARFLGVAGLAVGAIIAMQRQLDRFNEAAAVGAARADELLGRFNLGFREGATNRDLGAAQDQLDAVIARIEELQAAQDPNLAAKTVLGMDTSDAAALAKELSTLETEFLDLSKAVRTAEEITGPLIDTFGFTEQQVVRLADAMDVNLLNATDEQIRSMINLARETGSFEGALAAVDPQAGQFAEKLTDVASGAQDAQEALDELEQTLDGLIGKWLGAESAALAFEGAVDELLTTINEQGVNFKEQFPLIREAFEALEEAGVALLQGDEAPEQAAVLFLDQAAALKELIDVYEAAGAPVEDLKALLEGQVTAILANNTSIPALGEALRLMGLEVDPVTGELLAFTGELANVEGASPEVQAAVDALTAHLDLFGEEADIEADKIVALLDELGLLDEVTATPEVEVDTDPAFAGIQSFIERIEALTGINIPVDFTVRTPPPGGGGRVTIPTGFGGVGGGTSITINDSGDPEGTARRVNRESARNSDR